MRPEEELALKPGEEVITSNHHNFYWCTGVFLGWVKFGATQRPLVVLTRGSLPAVIIETPAQWERIYLEYGTRDPRIARFPEGWFDEAQEKVQRLLGEQV